MKVRKPEVTGSVANDLFFGKNFWNFNLRQSRIVFIRVALQGIFVQLTCKKFIKNVLSSFIYSFEE